MTTQLDKATTDLLAAARYNNTIAALAAIEAGANIMAVEPCSGMTASLLFAKARNADAVMKLAILDARTLLQASRHGFYPCTWLARHKMSSEVIQLSVLERKVLTITNSKIHGEIIAHESARQDDFEGLMNFATHDPELLCKPNNFGDTPADFFAYTPPGDNYGLLVELARVCPRAFVMPSARKKDGNNILTNLVWFGQIETAEAIISVCPELKKQDGLLERLVANAKAKRQKKYLRA